MKRCVARGQRGAVTIETALVVGIILTLIVFCHSLGLLGFLQITADAAAGANARDVSLGVADANGPNDATHRTYLQMPTSGMSSVAQPAATPDVAVDYGYNATDPTEQQNSGSNRYGGSAMMQPELQQSTISRPGLFNLAGKSIGVSAIGTEPLWTECGAHFNVSNANGACGSSGAPSTFAVNYFTQGENTPPYFVGFSYAAECFAEMPWSACASGYSDFRAFGLAEVLDDDDWAQSNAGVGGPKDYSTFQNVACHQRYFAIVAQFFVQFPNFTDQSTGLFTNSTNRANMAAMIKNGINLHAFASSPGWTGFDSTTNGAIQTIYSWDRNVTSGPSEGNGAQPETNPTYTFSRDNGC